jgi:glucose/arabinose dehydrogenase
MTYSSDDNGTGVTLASRRIGAVSWYWSLGVRAFMLAAALLVAVDLQASAGGRSGFSGDPTTSGAACNVCHAPDGATAPIVTVVGPNTVEAGSTQLLYVLMGGGPEQSAGVGISIEGGIGELAPVNPELQLLSEELTHTSPKGFTASFAVFFFNYTAPNYDTDVTLRVAVNSSDGNLDLQGDGIATTSHGLTIVNGFEPPPDPPVPPTGEMRAILYTTGLDKPVAIENMGDNRLFVVERRGRIQIIRASGTLRTTPFLNISSSVDDASSEQGLLGLAFHPDYDNNGYFYVYYTRDPGSGADRTRISRFTVTSDRHIADPNSELVLMEFEQPFSNHNGGDLHFGPDGYLHIASGDGGSGGDPQNNGQTTTTLLGKVLRIDVDTPAGAGTGPDCDISGSGAYSIAPGNAYVDGVGGDGCDEIYVLGARNPWRFSFDSLTGAMWIGDVGQNAFEEVHYLSPGGSGGLNLGWRCFEGTEPFNLANCNKVYLPPVHTYSHASGGCSITGGRVYRGSVAPLLQGQYLFTDFCQSSIRALSGPPGNLTQRIVVPAGELSNVSTFGEDDNGEIYAAELNTGNIYKLEPALPFGC